jgi:hypothetical protein
LERLQVKSVPRKILFAALLVALAAAAPVGARLVADKVSTPDPAGDGDPDITEITAGSNGSGGLTFIVRIGNRTELAPDEAVQVFIDADHNEATGTQPNGVEYAIQMDQTDVVLFRWDGSEFVAVENSSVYGYIFDGFRVGVNRSDVGSPTDSISYWVETVSGDHGDDAPNGVIASLPLSTTPLTLTVRQFVATKTVKVGKRYTAAMRVQRSDLEELSSAGLVKCTAKLGKKTLKVDAVFPEDVAGCVGTAPKAAKRKTIKLTLTFELDGVKVSRTAGVNVR